MGNEEKGWVKIGEPPPEIISVIKIGDYFNWRKFRKEPSQILLFTKTGIYEWIK